MKNAKKILCMLLSLMLVLGVVLVGTITTTMAAPQTGWSVSSTVSLRSTGTQWDQLTIVWDHFRDATGGASTGFNSQVRRIMNGPTAFSVWHVYEVSRDGIGDPTFDPITVHPAQNASPNNQTPVRVWAERTTALERLQIRQSNVAWHGELRIRLTVVALCTVENTPEQIRNAPALDFNDADTRAAVLAMFDTDNYIDNIFGSGLRLVRHVHAVEENLLNVGGLTDALADAQRILDRNDGLLRRYQEDFIEALEDLVEEAIDALASTDVVGIGDDIARLTVELRALVDNAENYRFFLHEVMDPIAPGAWGFIEFFEMFLQIASPLFSLITGAIGLITSFF